MCFFGNFFQVCTALVHRGVCEIHKALHYQGEKRFGEEQETMRMGRRKGTRDNAENEINYKSKSDSFKKAFLKIEKKQFGRCRLARRDNE